MPDAGIAGEA